MTKGRGKKADIALTPAEFCPIRQTVRLLGKQWTMLILKEIHYSRYNRLSFMELSKRLKGASSKVLSGRLKEMVGDGLLRRKAFDEITPPRVYYYLTPVGKDACKILAEFKKFGLKWGPKESENCHKIDCELCAEARAEGRATVPAPPA